MFSGSGKSGRSVIRSSRYPMLTLFDEVNRFFEDTLPAAQTAKSLTGFSPAIDVTENEREYVVRGEFPGIPVEAIQLELRENSLTLSGEKKYEQEKIEGTRHYSERSFGSFKRTFTFDAEVDEDNALAEMKNGVLSVRIPKAAKEVKGTKRLTIKAH